MPTILRHNGWRVVIYPNDHRPPHVHVVGINEHARFESLCDLGTVKLMSNIGLTYAQVQVLATYLSKHVQKLCIAWGRIHDRG